MMNFYNDQQGFLAELEKSLDTPRFICKTFYRARTRGSLTGLSRSAISVERLPERDYKLECLELDTVLKVLLQDEK